MKWYTIAISLLMFTNGYSQMQKLKLVAIAGSQSNAFDSGFSTDLKSTVHSFSLGAGSYFYLGNFFIGTEFQFLNGNRSDTDYRLSLSGMNTTFSMGYDVLKSEVYSLEPNIGFVMMKNKIISDDVINNQSAYFDKNSTGVVPSIDFSITNSSGLSYGVKVGYQMMIDKNAFWENGINKENSGFSDPMKSLLIQIKLGGIIKMKKKVSLTETTSSTVQTQNYKMPMKTNTIDNKGDKLFSIIYPNPDKETIILLHGGPGFPGTLSEVDNDLKNRFQVIIFHQRGTKKSPCVSKDYSIEAYLSDIEAVRKFHKIDKFHLWGHSWGGLYAQIYAEKYTDNLLSLFLCSPGSGTNIQWKQTEKEVMQLNKSKTTGWEWTKMGMNSFLGMLGSDKAYKRLFAQVMKNYNKGFILTDESADIEDFNLLKAAPVNRTRPAIIKYPLLEGLSDPDFKITILYGDQDIYSTSKTFVIDRYPTAEVFTVSNSGHIPWLHNPQAYKDIVDKHY